MQFFCAFAAINSPKSQIRNCLGPCSRHRKLRISEIDSDQGEISEIICGISGNEFPAKFWYM